MKQFFNIRAFALTAVVALAFTTRAQENSGTPLVGDRYSFSARSSEVKGSHFLPFLSPLKHRQVERVPMAATRSGVVDNPAVSGSHLGSQKPGVAPTPANPQSAYRIYSNALGQRVLGGRLLFTYDSSGQLLKSNKLTVSGPEVLLVDANFNPIGSVEDYEWSQGERTEMVYTSNGGYSATTYWGTDPNPTSRIVKEYDAAGRETLDERWSWSGSQNELICEQRYIFKFDERGNQLLMERWSWHNGKLEGDYKWSMTYDAQGNPLSGTDYRWNSEQNRFENFEMMEYTYNSEGYYSSMQKKEWDGAAWLPAMRYLCSFDSESKTLVLSIELLTNGEWVKMDAGTIVYLNSPQTPLRMESTTDLNLFTYDAANRQTSEKYYNKEGTADWTLEEEGETAYDEAGRITERWHKYVDERGVMGGSRAQTHYTSAGYIQEEILSGWSNSAWGAGRKTAYTYDAANRFTSYTESNWDVNTGGYLDQYKETRSYDSSGRLLTEVTFLYDWEVSKLRENEAVKYNYAGASSVDQLDDVSAGVIYVASGEIVLEGFAGISSCVVCTLDGAVIKSVDREALLTGRVQLSMPQGVYVVRTDNAAYKVVVP